MPRSRHVTATMLALLLLSLSPGTPPTAAPGTASESKLVDGAAGGVLQVGMWMISMPEGAYSGPARLTIASSSMSPRVCQLDIVPAEKNSFSRQALLMVRLPKGQVSPQTRIECFDPGTKSWKAVPGSRANVSAGTVSAPLSHFSLYQVTDGRSGW
jgi:hypothetical protein